jgi:GT2 family glycosyltransferase
VKEYTLAELRDLLSPLFGRVRILLQRNYLATRIAPLTGEPADAGFDPEESVLSDAEIDEDNEDAPYFLGMATNGALPRFGRRVDLGPPEMTERDRRYIQNLEGGVAERDREIERARQAVAEHEQVSAVSVRALADREEKLGSLQARLRETQEERAAEIERRNRYIQNLEGGVRERDDRIRDLEILQTRREVALALRLVQAGIRVNRLFGKAPTRTYRWLRDRFARRTPPPAHRRSDAPLFSVLIPVYNHSRFVQQSIESVLGQTFADFECVIYDDASTEPEVRDLLERYADHEKLSVTYGRENLGISRALNRCISRARGEYVAFLDCDDFLEKDALRKVARALEKSARTVDFLYTNRIDVDEKGEFVGAWDFTNRTFGDLAEELLRGMCCSHLKVIRKEALRRTGLFRKEFDTAQDYDIALRLSECCTSLFLPDAVYRHRVHRSQATQESNGLQQALAERARQTAVRRRQIARGDFAKSVSIVVLSLNRVDDTKRCIGAVKEHTRLPHEILVIDNGSTEDALGELRAFAASDRSFRLHESGRNIGCGGGRNLGAGMVGGEYVVFLDNDIEVSAGWLEALLTEMETDPRLAACCCRVVFPNGKIQFNGGGMNRGARRVRFDLLDTGKDATDLSTLETHDCDWVPGGATMFRRELLLQFPYDTEVSGAYEDNDWSMRVRSAGYRLRNAPLATVTHHHMDFNPEARKDRHYVNARYDKGVLESTLAHFSLKHGVFIDEEDLYRYLGYEGSNAFIERHGKKRSVSA